MKKKLAILLLAVLFVGSELQAQDTAKPALRTWKDSTGQFSIQATFVRVSGDKVVLQGIDKKEISLPHIKLSAADQQYVKARLNGLPDDVQRLLDTIEKEPAARQLLDIIEKEATAYPSRSADLKTLMRWLADGDYRLARSKAAGIIKQQRNLRLTKQDGLPNDIQHLLATIEKEAAAYPSRSDELKTLIRWLADGDYRLARSKAAGIINQQRNLRQAQEKGVPDDIQQLLDIIEKETIAYPSRSDELKTLNRWLADGDYRLARSKAAGIINQQRNLRLTKQDGLPDDIQQLIATIEKEATAYPSRSGDLKTLIRWLADGDYRLARSKAAGIIKQQRNLK
jgi:hypothetical protein